VVTTGLAGDFVMFCMPDDVVFTGIANDPGEMHFPLQGLAVLILNHAS
jgi:hypothetical protein